MKVAPSSLAKPPAARVPIVLRRPEQQSSQSLLLTRDAPVKTENPLKTTALPKLSTFAPSPSSGENAPDENNQLKEEIAECRRSLEEWTKAEIEWSNQRRLFKVMAETVSDVIVLMDRQGNRTWTNPAYCHLLGYQPEELVGTFVFSEVHPDDKDYAIQALNTAVEQGVPQQAEFRIQQKDGSWLSMQTETVPIVETDGRVDSVVLMGHDVTEQKQLEEALALASTQVTAAGMVEGLARDFDQILTNAAGNLAIAKNLNGPTNAVAVRLNEIERALQRARDLIEQMFSLTSHSDQPRVRASMEPVVQEAVAEVIKGTMVRAEYSFNRKLPDLELDVESFSHAVRNILTNCVQSMDKGVIRVSADYIPQEYFKSNAEIPLKPGNYVRLRIQDQGHGIPERIVPRVFEPYFTTRQGSQGLGLTTALSAIQRLGGTITLESTVNVGTTVSIYVPAAHAPLSSSSGPSASGSTTLPKVMEKKRILLMDDEQMILDIVSRMLTHLGYEVKTCTDGSQAIAAFAKAKSTGQMFDVVLMDLVIPNGVGGQDAVHTIIKIDPGAKVVASSGHVDHPVMVDHKKYGFTAVLEKPYKLEKLQQVIDAVVNSPG
ncbi:MAG TPA: PAS domain S-box protein [Candidatus Methylacidiphilales bacterium]|nr:PAS domain S-box protein [Candidatus Methylacidiphilales bacterium]